MGHRARNGGPPWPKSPYPDRGRRGRRERRQRGIARDRAVASHVSAAASPTGQASASSSPKKVATPLPPRKPQIDRKAMADERGEPGELAGPRPQAPGRAAPPRPLARHRASASRRRRPCCRCAARSSPRYCPSRCGADRPGRSAAPPPCRRAPTPANSQECRAQRRDHRRRSRFRKYLPPASSRPSHGPARRRPIGGQHRPCIRAPSKGVFLDFDAAWRDRARRARRVEQHQIGRRAHGQPPAGQAQPAGGFSDSARHSAAASSDPRRGKAASPRAAAFPAPPRPRRLPRRAGA